MHSRLGIALVCAVPLLGAWEWLTAPDPDVAAGNQALEAGEFRSALDLYERAEKQRGTAAELELDKGIALYKLAAATDDQAERERLLERAESAFRRAAETSSDPLKSAAYYNLGNAAFLRERWTEAIDGYRRALLANQDNDNARYNLELTLRKIEREKNPPQSGNQGQPSQGGDQGQQGSQGQQGQQGQPGQGDPQQGNPGQQGDPGQQDPSGQDDQGQGQGQDPGDPQQGQPGDNQGSSGQSGSQPPPGSSGGDGSGDSKLPYGDPQPGQGYGGTDDRSEHDRKLDALENRSRDLRRRRLRRDSRSRGSQRFGAQKDW